jgi:hypothetical protein
MPPKMARKKLDNWRLLMASNQDFYLSGPVKKERILLQTMLHLLLDHQRSGLKKDFVYSTLQVIFEFFFFFK